MLLDKSKFTHLTTLEKLKLEKNILESELPYFKLNHPERNLEPLEKRLLHLTELIPLTEFNEEKQNKILTINDAWKVKRNIPEKIKHIQKRIAELEADNSAKNNAILEIFRSELEIFHINFNL